MSPLNDSFANLSVVEIDSERSHPFIRTQANGAKLAFKLFGVCGLS